MKPMFLRLVSVIIMAAFIMTAAGCGESTGTIQSEPGKVRKAGDVSKILEKGKVADLAGITQKQRESVMSDILELAGKYFELCYPLIEDNARQFKMKLPTKLDFKPDARDKAKGTELSELSANSTITMSAPCFSITSGAAGLAYSLDSAIAAHNLAAAIRLSLERMEEKTFTGAGLHPMEDSAAIYLYAISLEPERIDSYLNAGNLFLELAGQKGGIASTPYFSFTIGRSQLLDKSKEFFEKALDIDDESSEACSGMAGYYYAKGDVKKFMEWLLKSTKRVGFSKKTLQKSDEVENVARDFPAVADFPADKAKEALDRLSSIKEYTTADYLEELAPDTASAIRQKMNSLPRNDMDLSLPAHPYASEILSYEIYNQKYIGAVTDYYNAVSEKLYHIEEQFINKKAELEEKLSSRMDSIDEGILDELAEQAGQGDLSALDKINQMMNFPGQDYNQSPDLKTTVEYRIMQNNRILLNLRWVYYFKYFESKIRKADEFYQRRSELLAEKMDENRETEYEKTEPLSLKLQETRDDLEAERLDNKIKQIMNEHGRQRNQLRQAAFSDLTGEMYPVYIDVVSMLKRLWNECVPLIRFIENEDERTLFYYNLCQLTVNTAGECIRIAMDAGSIYDGEWEIARTDDWEAYQQKIKKIESEQKTARERAQKEAELEAARSKMPAAIKYIQNILGEGAAFSIGIGPASFSVTPTSFTLEGAFIGAGEISHDWVDNKTTAGVGVGGKFSFGMAEAGAKTLLTYTIDNNSGDVIEIDWKASAGAEVEITENLKAGLDYTTSVMHDAKTSTSLGWSAD